MALDNCRECTLDVSSEALRCPHCGVQIKKTGTGFAACFFKVIFYLWNLLMLVWMILGIEIIEKVPVLNNWENLMELSYSGLDEYAILAVWVAGSIILGFLALVTKPQAN